MNTTETPESSDSNTLLGLGSSAVLGPTPPLPAPMDPHRIGARLCAFSSADMEAYAKTAMAAMRERCANQVPTNWLDPLLTGPGSVVPATTDCRVVERLLRAVQERIRGA